MKVYSLYVYDFDSETLIGVFTSTRRAREVEARLKLSKVQRSRIYAHLLNAIEDVDEELLPRSNSIA